MEQGKDYRLNGPHDMTPSPTGEPRYGFFVIPTTGGFIVPQEHLKELIQYRSQNPPHYNRFLYTEYKPKQKYRYLMAGLLIGSIPGIIVTIIRLL